MFMPPISRCQFDYFISRFIHKLFCVSQPTRWLFPWLGNISSSVGHIKLFWQVFVFFSLSFLSDHCLIFFFSHPYFQNNLEIFDVLKAYQKENHKKLGKMKGKPNCFLMKYSIFTFLNHLEKWIRVFFLPRMIVSVNDCRYYSHL